MPPMQTSLPSPLTGVFMVLGAAVLWGTTGTAQSFAPPQLSPYWVGAGRLAFAALFFLPWLAVSERSSLSRAAMRRLPAGGIALCGLCMCVYNLAFFAGVRACGVAVGTAIALGSGPVWAGLLQALIARRWPAAPWWLGTVVAVSGVVAMTLGGSAALTASATGIVLCLTAGLSYAVYAQVNQRLVAQAPTGLATASVFLVAAMLATPAAAVLAELPAIQWADLGIVLWLGVVSTGMAYLLFSHALRHISAATAVVLALAEPVTAFVLAVLIVGERPGAAGVVGLLGVLMGLGVVIGSERRQSAR
jgi:drug/metabolite transporter, DME family